jgi:hypothetical protein
MEIENYFRVKYGFSSFDQVSITEKELEKALYAQKFGEVVQIGGKQVNGRNIIVIEPHYHKYTGWYPNYEPTTGEDWKQIERDCPKGLDNIIRVYRERVDYLLNTGRKNMIGKNIYISELDKPKEETKNLPDDIQKRLGEVDNNFKI